MKELEERIHLILGDENERNYENSCRYLDYLKVNIKFPLQVTGIEDFPWEEPYVFGVFDKQEYEILKEDNPSYTDIFELLDLGFPRDFSDITASIRRLSDQKIFEIGLSWLKVTDENDRMYNFLDDYAVWHTNF